MPAIITQPILVQQPLRWQDALKDMVTDPQALLQYLELSSDAIDWIWDKQFPLRVTQSYMNRMKKGDPHDPLLRQVISVQKESQPSANFSNDPLEEKKFNPVPGLIHKYSSRVLLTVTSSCAIHCRYCFRRHFPYEANNPGFSGWDQALEYIKNKPEILEVILSGGDPLMATDKSLEKLIQELSAIPHIQFVRFHTRLPVMIPERITTSLLRILENSRFPMTMVYHVNHPAELIPAIATGVKRLKAANVQVLNQSVLLQGINDNFTTLKELSITLFKAGILPYYMHLLDPVQGAAHFEVSHEQASKLQEQLKANLPGFLVPRFVREVPNALSKISLDLLPL